MKINGNNGLKPDDWVQLSPSVKRVKKQGMGR